MQAALDFAGYIFAITFLFGLGLVAYAIYAYTARLKPLPPRPILRDLPSRAVEVAHRALQELKQQYHQNAGLKRERIGFEINRLELRIRKQEETHLADQDAYFDAVRHCEGVWKEWQLLRSKAQNARGQEKSDLRRKLPAVESAFRVGWARAEEQRDRVGVLDRLAVEELKSQGVLASQETAAGEPEQGAPDLPASAEPDGLPADEGAAEPGSPLSRESLPSGPEALHQADFADPTIPKAGRPYGDSEFVLSFAPEGIARFLDLRGSSFKGVKFGGLHRYQDCDFRGAELADLWLERQEKPHQFLRCTFDGADFRRCDLTYVLFSKCDLSRTRWEGARLDTVKFVKCRTDGLAWGQADLSRTIMSPDMLEGVDFSDAAAPPRAQGRRPTAAADGTAPPPATPPAPTGDPSLDPEQPPLAEGRREDA